MNTQSVFSQNVIHNFRTDTKVFKKSIWKKTKLSHRYKSILQIQNYLTDTNLSYSYKSILQIQRYLTGTIISASTHGCWHTPLSLISNYRVHHSQPPTTVAFITWFLFTFRYCCCMSEVCAGSGSASTNPNTGRLYKLVKFNCQTHLSSVTISTAQKCQLAARKQKLHATAAAATERVRCGVLDHHGYEECEWRRWLRLRWSRVPKRGEGRQRHDLRAFVEFDKFPCQTKGVKIEQDEGHRHNTPCVPQWLTDWLTD